jgi:hypothetical protein
MTPHGLRFLADVHTAPGFCSRWWICRLDTDRRIRSCLAMQAKALAERYARSMTQQKSKSFLSFGKLFSEPWEAERDRQIAATEGQYRTSNPGTNFVKKEFWNKDRTEHCAKLDSWEWMVLITEAPVAFEQTIFFYLFRKRKTWPVMLDGNIFPKLQHTHQGCWNKITIVGELQRSAEAHSVTH